MRLLELGRALHLGTQQRGRAAGGAAAGAALQLGRERVRVAPRERQPREQRDALAGVAQHAQHARALLRRELLHRGRPPGRASVTR